MDESVDPCSGPAVTECDNLGSCVEKRPVMLTSSGGAIVDG